MRYDRVRSREGFDILDAAEIWPRADAAGWAALAEVEAAWARGGRGADAGRDEEQAR